MGDGGSQERIESRRGPMDMKIDFTDKEITPWGGMILLKKVIEKTKINAALQTMNLPQQRSNRGYDPIQLINNFWVSLWCGANHFEHLEVTRQDPVVQEIFGWKKMAGHKAFQRYFGKFTQALNQEVFGALYTWFFSELKFERYTLDCDSTVLTRYGNQQGATVGYNPIKRGRKSHHPLIAFIPEHRMVANVWLRPGNSHTANNFLSFLVDTLNRFKGKTLGLLRADCGFFSKEILAFLENCDRPISYIIAVKLDQKIQRAIVKATGWTRLTDGIEIAEMMYDARRMIIVRQHVEKRPKASGKQLRLFQHETWYNDYRFSCYVTNMDLSAPLIWKLYRDRGDAENRIKELKYDFGVDSFNTHDFFATEATLNFVMMAYNLMSLFRQAIIQQPVQQTMKTLRYKVFAIGSYITRSGNERTLKLSLAVKRRDWFTGLWSRCDNSIWEAAHNFHSG
jgi:hypothetical protein